MLIPPIVIHAALISISAMIALILAIAWHEFGRPRHALTWAVAFGLGALLWAIDLGTGTRGMRTSGLHWPTLAVAGYSIVLNTLGFRQRAGIPENRAALLGVATVHAALVTVLAFLGASTVARAMPLSLLSAAMFWLAGRALTGRRKGERIAVRVAQSGLFLLSLLNFAFLAGMISSLAGWTWFDLAMLGTATMLLMPAIVTGIGLFTIILLAADLADQARRLAASDMLTGVLNRRGFDEAANAMIAAARRSGRMLSLGLIDVDRFKQVNDLFGHPAGDRVLCAICRRIGEGIGRRDILARIGGEEFAVVFADMDLPGATARAEQVRQSVASLEVEVPEPHCVTASFGVTAFRGDGDDLPALLRRADEALYRAKAQGRDQVCAQA